LGGVEEAHGVVSVCEGGDEAFLEGLVVDAEEGAEEDNVEGGFGGG
jgi:hypothetical protein